MPLRIVEGYTGALDFDLLVGTSAVLLTTADDVRLILKTRDGHLIATSSSVSMEYNLGASSSETWVRYLPEAGDLVATRSPYSARFKVTTLGRDVYYPSGVDPDPWTVGAA